MRSAIAIIMAILGTVLVLSGAAALWASAIVRPAGAEAGAAAGPPESRLDPAAGRLVRLPGPDRLIIWGVVLLALSAVAAGAITISATATAGNRSPTRPATSAPSETWPVSSLIAGAGHRPEPVSNARDQDYG